MVGLRRVWDAEDWVVDREASMLAMIAGYLIFCVFTLNFYVSYWYGLPGFYTGYWAVAYYLKVGLFGLSVAEWFLVASCSVSFVCLGSVCFLGRKGRFRWGHRLLILAMGVICVSYSLFLSSQRSVIFERVGLQRAWLVEQLSGDVEEWEARHLREELENLDRLMSSE